VARKGVDVVFGTKCKELAKLIVVLDADYGGQDLARSVAAAYLSLSALRGGGECVDIP
jgi:hypothetical protein